MKTKRVSDILSIFPSFRAMVYDAWANGREGYYQNKGEFRNLHYPVYGI